MGTTKDIEKFRLELRQFKIYPSTEFFVIFCFWKKTFLTQPNTGETFKMKKKHI